MSSLLFLTNMNTFFKGLDQLNTHCTLFTVLQKNLLFEICEICLISYCYQCVFTKLIGVNGRSSGT